MLFFLSLLLSNYGKITVFLQIFAYQIVTLGFSKTMQYLSLYIERMVQIDRK